jgi:hypothetical protein
VARRVLVHLGLLAYFGAAAVAMTWPLAANLDVAIAHPGDPLLVTWILDWDYYGAAHAPLHIFDAPMFVPFRYTLAFTENLFGIALLCLPLKLAGASPLLLYNLAVLLGFAGAGYAAALLARHVSGSALTGAMAGTFFAFVPWRFSHLTHLQHLWTLWLPILVLCLLRLREKPTFGRAAALAAVFVMNGLTNLHWLAFGLVAITWAALLMRERRIVILALAAIVTGLAILAPILWQYRTASRIYATRGDAAETEHYSSQPRDWLIASMHSRLYGPLTNDGTVDPERWAFPGVLAIVLAAFAVITRWQRIPMTALDRLLLVLTILFALLVPLIAFVTGSFFLARRTSIHLALGIFLTLLGFIGSLGMHAQLGRFLFATTPLFQGIRAPARWAMIAYLGITILIALAPRRRIAALVVTALFLFELRAAPIRYYLTTGETPAVYTWLAQQRDVAPVLELPADQQHAYAYLYYQTVHHQPLINGVSGFTPPAYREGTTRRHARTIIVHDARGDSVYTNRGQLRAFFPAPPNRLITPQHWQRIDGALVTRGTLARGTRTVNAWFDNRRVRIPLGNTINATIPRRPDNVRMDTDLQIEVIDASGRSTWLPQVWLRWTRPNERVPNYPLPQTADLGAYRRRPLTRLRHPLPARGARGDVALLPACGEKVAEGRMRGVC